MPSKGVTSEFLEKHSGWAIRLSLQKGSESFGLADLLCTGHIGNMQMQIDYPDSLPDSLKITQTQFEAEARMAMAVKLFELKRLSSGLAARLAGVDRVDFLLSLNRYGVPVIASDEAELASDLSHA